MAKTNWWNLYTQIDVLLAGQATIIARLNALQVTVTKEGANIMAQVDDLKAAAAQIDSDVKGIGTSVQNAVALIKQLQSGQINANDPQVQAVIDDLTARHTDLQNSTSALTSAAQPTP